MVAWDPLDQLAIKTTPPLPQTANRPTDPEKFSADVLFSQVIFGCVELAIKMNPHNPFLVNLMLDTWRSQVAVGTPP